MLLLFGCMTFCTFQAQDVIVKNNLEALTVYNLEISDNFVFYQLSADEGAAIQKLPLKEIMIIRKADGTKIDPSEAKPATTSDSELNKTYSRILIPQEFREEVTAQVCSEIRKKKTGYEFNALTSEDNILVFSVISEEMHTLKVINRKKTTKECVIPEYVDINGTLYSVTEIGEAAFMNCRTESCQFPKTLKRIGKRAFYQSFLRKIILPEGLEYIEQEAFYRAGHYLDEAYYKKVDVEEIYIPTTVKDIGKDAFREMGDITSFRGYFQGKIDCLPKWINSENGQIYGLDDNAIEEYEAHCGY